MDTDNADTGLDLEKLAEEADIGDATDSLAAVPTSDLRALIEAAKREELRNRREGTHAPDCHLWGPRHYGCLTREFAAANARIADLEAIVKRLTPSPLV